MSWPPAARRKSRGAAKTERRMEELSGTDSSWVRRVRTPQCKTVGDEWSQKHSNTQRGAHHRNVEVAPMGG